MGGPSRWPKAIGISGIVIGALLLITAVMRPVNVITQKMQISIVMKGDADAEEFFGRLLNTQIFLGVVFAVIALLLILGSILLLKRKKIAPVLLRVWAVCYLLFGIFAVWKALPLVEEQMLYSAKLAVVGEDTPPMDMEVFSSAMGIAAKVMTGLSLVWVLALTVFVLLWFQKRKVRDEVAVWS